ncbi:MAG: 2-amino-4-hydroxy-6-hydroxymethyldihydropteridine diphosphokinase [Flavobacteriia bacterium]|jgi:2-amino-4-hydroxy-6-hydroxymethyldihydropteridine diphosphokinase
MEIKNTFFLSIGSNLGDRLSNLQFAINSLKSLNCEILEVSSVYETEPIGFIAEQTFYNAAIKGYTSVGAEEFMTSLLNIEKNAGRERDNSTNYSSRPLDVDIIFFNNLVLKSDFLEIPHPRYRERKFVLLPLIEIQKDLLDPHDLKPLSVILVSSGDTSEIKRLETPLF